MAPGQRNREPLGRTLGTYGALLGNRRLLDHVGAGGFFYAGMFADIAGTPFAYVTYHHVPAQLYGRLFADGILGELRGKPADTSRITTSEHSARTILWPALEKVLPDYPDIHVEMHVDPSFTDIVSEQFDAGVRLREALAKDMIAVRMGPDMRMALVDAPAYFEKHGKPRTPQELAEHNAPTCASLPTEGSLRGSWKRTGARSACALTGNWPATTSP